MIPYPKIDTLLERDEKFKVKRDAWKKPSFEYLASRDWIFTEKIHGTNIQVEWSAVTRTYCLGGRKGTVSDIPPFLVKKLESIFDPRSEQITAMFKDTASSVTFYGEGFGAKIQKGGGNYIPDGVDFALFDILVRTPEHNWWLERSNIAVIAHQLGLTVAPVIGTGTLCDAIDMAEEGITSIWGNFPAEGLVVKPAVELLERSGERVIGKIKTADFLK